MEVCRIIKAEKLEDINFENLGIHWTTKPEESHRHIVQNGEASFWVYAEIDESMIWDDYTSDDIAEHPGLETNGESGEHEITLRPGSEITILEVYDENQECVMREAKGEV